MANKTTNYNLTKPLASDTYNIDVPNGNMDIIDTELKKLNDGKAPSGHGLGNVGDGTNASSFLEMMKRGCGFYQVSAEVDSPLANPEWLGLLQIPRNIKDGKNSGAQLAFYDFSITKPRMWLRSIAEEQTGNWFELIHTGNATSLLPFLKIANGSYVGTGGKKYKFTFDFQPKILFFDGCFAIPYGTTRVSTDRDGITVGMDITWDGNSVTIGPRPGDYGFPWHFENATYYYAAIG